VKHTEVITNTIYIESKNWGITLKRVAAYYT